MKILYVGQLGEGGTCLDRMRALQRVGYDVVGFNVSDFQSNVKILASIQWRLNPRWQLAALNQSLLQAADSESAIDMVWVDKGVWIFSETIRSLREKNKLLAVHFTPDPQILFHRSRHFIKSIPHYDHLITTKSFEEQLYADAGARHVILSRQSYCPIRYKNPIVRFENTADVGFIGHYERHYDQVTRTLAANVEVGVWGDSWLRGKILPRMGRRYVRGGSLFGADYVNSLASFKIGLGLLSKYIPEQHTTRSFEIPAAGSFLLAERTDEHLGYFSEGEEAEFFDSTDELVDKTKFYLSSRAVRRRIAAKGRERCLKSGYDNDSVLLSVMKEIL